MADGDVVVVANPQSAPTGEVPTLSSSPYPGGDANPANHPAVLANQRNAQFVQDVVKSEADVTGEDVVVVANKFRDTAATMVYETLSVKAAQFVLPCFGKKVSLRDVMLSLRFNLTNRTFGEGRAGANYASGGPTSPIDINVGDFRTYMAHGEGGAGYLLAHEMAHIFRDMREYHQRIYTAFRKTDGKGMTEVAAKAAFAKTQGFRDVEARANTIARAIYDALSKGKQFGFTPTNGYATCP